MSHEMQPTMTPDEFLEWEDRQEERWEFDGFKPVAMTGGTNAHYAIMSNLVTALTTRLRGKPCRVRAAGMQVQIGERYRYPDAMIFCTPLPLEATVVTEPAVLFEILSKSFVRTDRTTKLLEYRLIPSLQHYVMLEQDQAMATVYTRTQAGWVVDLLVAGDVLRLPEAGIEVTLSEIYEEINLPDLRQASEAVLEEG